MSGGCFHHCRLSGNEARWPAHAAVTPVPTSHVGRCWNTFIFYRILGTLAFPWVEMRRQGGRRHSLQKEKGLCSRGLRGREQKGYGLSHQCLRAGDGKCLVARMFVFILFYFSKPWDRRKKKRPPISWNSSCFLLEGKSKRSRPLSFNQMTPPPPSP